MTRTQGAPTVVLVHGAVPGHGADTRPLTDLAGDAAALRATLDSVDGDAVVCGHSYGGAVVTEGAAGHPAARHLVFITAFALAVGESCASAAVDSVGPEAGESLLGPALISHDDGTLTLDPEASIAALYHDCDRADIELALAHLGPQARGELSGVATQAAWTTIPSAYAVCTEDRGVTPALQRAFARRTAHVVEWPTSHSPFLSRPDLVADLLVGLAAGVARAEIAQD